jgi:3-methyladenine DNA glycosylase Tag
VNGPERCAWANGSELMVAYHDKEWGVPSREDTHLFEMLLLEGAQAGLSWSEPPSSTPTCKPSASSTTT